MKADTIKEWREYVEKEARENGKEESRERAAGGISGQIDVKYQWYEKREDEKEKGSEEGD